jgi:hypothetical protein
VLGSEPFESDPRAVGRESEGVPWRGEIVTNPPGLELTPAQNRKLRGIASPDPSVLSLPTEHGRFRALRLWGSPKKGSLDPTISESYKFQGVDLQVLRTEFERISKPLGFTLAEPYKFGSRDLTAYSKKLPHHEGVEVIGWLYAERELRADKAETHRRDRLRWLGIAGGIIPGVVLIILAFSRLNTLGFLAGPGGIFMGIALVSGLSFANVDYWSDVIAVRLHSVLPNAGRRVDPVTAITDYVAQVWVVRALTQDWESKAGSGRTLIAGIDAQGLGAVRESLRSAICSGPLR